MFFDDWTKTAQAVFNQPGMDAVFFGNSVRRYLIAVLIFFCVYGLMFLIRSFLLLHYDPLLKKQGSWRSRFLKALKAISPFFYFFLAFFLALRIILISEYFDKALDALLTLLVVYEAIRFVQLIVEFSFRKSSSKKDETMLHAIKLATAILIWAIGLLVILSNLGYDVTTLAASLGIGGIAVAFAAKGILEDLFASYSIYFDKPFKIGDYVTIGVDNGTIRKIGLKTTRIKTLQGQELVVSNKELTSVRINNYTRMEERRIVIHFSVDYNTPPEKLEKIPTTIKVIVEKQVNTRFDRAHLSQFGEFGLAYELVYFVLSPDYSVYMDIQQAILLDILRTLEQENITISITGQSLYFLKHQLRKPEETAA